MATIQEPTLDLALKAYSNELTPDIDNDYTVRVETQETPLTLEHIALRVANRLGKEYTDALGILTVACEEAADYAASGFCISTPLFYLRPVASGVLTEEELSQPLDTEKVKAYGSLSQGPRLKEAFAKTNLKLFLQPAPTGPYLTGMVDAIAAADAAATKSDAAAVPLQAGRMVVLNARNAKVTGTDPSVGITLTSVSDPSVSFFIGPDQISPNTPSRLQFILPAGVTDGQWRVKVTTQYTVGKNILKTPRSFEMKRPVTIGELPDTGDSTGGGTTGGDTTGGGTTGGGGSTGGGGGDESMD